MSKLLEIFAKHIDMSIDLGNTLKVILIDTAEIKELDRKEHNSNIFCIDNESNIIWQIDSKSGLIEKDSFVYIKKVNDGIIAHRFFGTEYLINPSTGVTQKVGWHK